jgi:hypothetical protein
MSHAPLSKNPPLCQGPDPKPRKPRHAIPAGGIDCHCHVFEDQTQYPLTPQRSNFDASPVTKAFPAPISRANMKFQRAST